MCVLNMNDFTFFSIHSFFHLHILKNECFETWNFETATK